MTASVSACDCPYVGATQIVLVEDDDAISEPLTRGLQREGFDITVTVDGPSGLKAGLEPGVALVILDVGLPLMGGLEVCRRLRAARPRLQILLLTALAEEVHTVDGLDAGADDYVAKPFRLAELLARIRAAVRRSAPPELEFAGVRVNANSRQAYLRDAELSMSPKEFDLLTALLADAGTVVTREVLLRDIWQLNWRRSGRTLDQHISMLRNKIGADRIVTVRGHGFRMVDPGS